MTRVRKIVRKGVVVDVLVLETDRAKYRVLFDGVGGERTVVGGLRPSCLWRYLVNWDICYLAILQV